MTLSVVARWDAPGAPEKLRAEVEREEAEYFAAIAALGISREAYLIAARECVKAARDFFEEKKIRSQRSTRDDDEGKGAARWSTLLSSFLRLLQDFGRVGWALCWGTIRTLARTFGTSPRAAWERLRMLQDAGLTRVWERWRNPDHTYEEGRSNILLLMVPVAVFEWWVQQPKAQALLASLGGVAQPALDSPPAAPPVPARASSPPAAPRSARKPAAPAAAAPEPEPEFFPGLFHEVRSKDKRYLGQDASEGGTMRAENAVACEDVLRDEAAAARAELEKNGWTLKDGSLPEVGRLARELGRMSVRAWLRESGRDGVLVERKHVIGLIAKDIARLAVDARTRWLAREELRREVAEAPAGRDKPRFLPAPGDEPVPPAAVEGEAETPEEEAERREAVAEFRASHGLDEPEAEAPEPAEPPPD